MTVRRPGETGAGFFVKNFQDRPKKTGRPSVKHSERGEQQMQRIKAPDPATEQTFTELVSEYQTSLLRMCYLNLHDKGLAEDAVQETFVKAFRGWYQFRGQSSEKTWLTKIAVNTCTDLQRGAWFRHTDRRVTPEMLPEAIIQPTETNLDLTLAVMNLPKKYREAIMLYYYQDMDVREIGTVLGIAQSSVSNRLKKGREMLRKALEGRI